jgi:hypothetical protein
MRQAIMIRVEAEDIDRWKQVHDAHRQARLDFGISDGPVYRQEGNPSAVLVQLDVEDVNRAMEWFKSELFRAGVQAAGHVRREIWIAQQPAAAHPSPADQE